MTGRKEGGERTELPEERAVLESAEAWDFLRVIFCFPASYGSFSRLPVIINWVIPVKWWEMTAFQDGRVMCHPSHQPSTGALLCSQKGFLVVVIWLLNSLLGHHLEVESQTSIGFYTRAWPASWGQPIVQLIFLTPFTGSGLSKAQPMFPDWNHSLWPK